MPSPTNTPQLSIWKGSFGDEYNQRLDAKDSHVRERVPLWAQIFSQMYPHQPKSVLEIGASVGINLRALRTMSDARFYATEPNEAARKVLIDDRVVPKADARVDIAAALSFSDASIDFVFTYGVLVHIHTDNLLESCKEIHRCAKQWIGCIEFFADKPEVVNYRGHDNLLFKRDYGAFWLDNFPDLRTAGYGFVWKRATGLGNPTWWLFEKR